MRRAVVLGSYAIVSLAQAIGAQAAPRSGLAEFEGVYAYHGSMSLAIVAADSIVFAIIDEARYPLRPLGADRFLNAVGDTIPFRRGADGVVSGFVERGVFFARRTPAVDATVAASVRAVPRQLGADGRPVAYVYKAPVDRGDGIRVGNVGDVGLDSATVMRVVNRVVDGSYPDVHGILVYRRGKLVVEEYFYGYDRDRVHQMRSASKSVVSALVGIAIDRGALSGDSELVTKRLPYASYGNPDPRKDRLMLRDLLSMRSGLACDDWNAASPGNESRVYESNDWVKFVLDLPLTDQPGTVGHYCSGNVAVAGRIVERATGKPLPAFAQENLFTPLGIRASDVRWNFTLSSENAGTFAQLYMRPRDMLKIGMLFQQQGKWNGRQVISRDWIARSTANWSTVGDSEYGYFWWHQWTNAATAHGPQRVDMVVATGNGGQKIYIVPTLDLIVVLTGGNFNTNSPSMTIMAKDLLPALLNRMGGAK
ncbi:MAG: beta-lactamase [Gemmatimonadetes bacterium]|nr:beta-lactamase [Gemmatimonadota bacterium]